MSVGRPALTLVWTAAVAAVLVQSLALSPTSRLAPLWVAVPTLGLLLVKLVRDLVRGPEGAMEPPSAARVASVPRSIDERRARRPREARLAAWALLSLALVYAAGIVVSVPLVLAPFLRFEGELPWRRSLAVAAGISLGFYLIFVRLLAVTLPPGALL